MTGSTTLPLPARRHRRSDHLLAALLAAAVAALTVLSLLVVPPAGTPATAAPRVALVVDAGASPDTALARARAVAGSAERAGTADVSVRVPRTPAEAAADVRYFAAQRAVERVVVVGPVAGAAAREAAADYPGASLVVRPAVPRTLR
jgi:hypothetical protein